MARDDSGVILLHIQVDRGQTPRLYERLSQIQGGKRRASFVRYLLEQLLSPTEGVPASPSPRLAVDDPPVQASVDLLKAYGSVPLRPTPTATALLGGSGEVGNQGEPDDLSDQALTDESETAIAAAVEVFF